MPRKEPPQGPISAQAQQDLVSEGMENFELPKSLVTRIARSALPENVKMQKETVLSLIKGSTVFINYLGATAHDVALSKQHKSISASDVLKALEMIEFGDLVDKLQAELLIYREQAKTDKSKKGSSNVNSSVAKGKTPSVSSTPKSVKGKEKATIVLPPTSASTSIALDYDMDRPESPSSASVMKEALELPQDEDLPEALEENGELGNASDDPEPWVSDEEEEPANPEEPVDTAALDLEDLRRDARGPEEALGPVDMED
ncbi:histone-fold-containing protein [Mycena sp. CBHHK59/15]|nr:histone-fold-containing protein [Mycena sp. CBHHK59/15]